MTTGRINQVTTVPAAPTPGSAREREGGAGLLAGPKGVTSGWGESHHARGRPSPPRPAVSAVAAGLNAPFICSHWNSHGAGCRRERWAVRKTAATFWDRRPR